MKNLLFYAFITVMSVHVMAQTTTEKEEKPTTPSPDFPGAVLFEWGMNYINKNSITMTTKAWQSQTFNIYYTYPMKLGDSRFAFVPGFGIGMERYSFSKPVTVVDSSGTTLLKFIADVPRFKDAEALTRTKLITNYLDVPVEFRIHSRKNDHKRSWYLAAGAKFGLRVNVKTRIKYEEFGNDKIEQDHHHFNVQSIRYGFYGRFGYGPFNIWYHHRGNELFKDDNILGFQNPGMNSIGISLSTF